MDNLKETIKSIIEKELQSDSFNERVYEKVKLKEVSFGVGDFLKSQAKTIIAEITHEVLKNDIFLDRLSRTVLKQIDVRIEPKPDL